MIKDCISAIEASAIYAVPVDWGIPNETNEDKPETKSGVTLCYHIFKNF